MPVVAGALILLAQPAAAETILIVARNDAPLANFSRGEVADLFLGRPSPGIAMTPLDQRDDRLRERFYRAVADMSPQSVRAYWAKRVFTGRGRPPQLLTEEEATRALAANPAVVTYVPANRKPEGSKVLLSIESGEE